MTQLLTIECTANYNNN